MELMKIDGSFGEGGGQIIRSAITLSAITKKPIRLENIRKNRKKDGLRAQHLTAIKLLGNICNAEIIGNEIGSTFVEFIPHEIEDRVLEENIGTAGSISLIMQVLIPAISFCKRKLELSITGGTDVAWSPTAEYTRQVLHEAYSRMGINFSMEIKRRGYYPKGNGLINLQISPSKQLQPINLKKRKTKEAKLFCSFSKISQEVIDNSIQKIQKKLQEKKFQITTTVTNDNALDAGSSLLIMSKDSDSIIGIDSLFDNKIQDFKPKIHQEFINSKFSVDEHLSDMLVLPASLTKEMSIFQVDKISSHLETNLYVTSKMTDCKYGIGKIDDGYEVRIVGSSDSSI